MSVAIAFNLSAQTKKAPHQSVAGIQKVQLLKKTNFVDNQTQFGSTFNQAPALLPLAKDINKLGKVLISHSANPNSYLVSQQTVMSSNNDLNLITFTHRKSLTNVIAGTTTNASGACQTSFSVDGGVSWDTLLVPWRGTQNAANAGRYPSGVIYNPAGNTTLANAYAVVCGPKLVVNSAPWIGSFFASESFAKTNNNMQAGVGPLDTVWARNYLQACDGGKFHVVADHNKDDGTNYTFIQSVKYDGTWNATTNSVDWTTSSHVPPYAVSAGGIDGYARSAYAWSKNGQIGYQVYVGVTASAVDPLAYAPIVYKTTDAGTTWNLMAGFNYSTIPSIDSSLIETSTPGVKRAFITEPMDVTVDANNNLHIATYVKSASSNSVDSTGYSWTWTKIEGYMFDIYTTTAAGGWNANYIETQYGKDLATTDDTQWGLGWDNRFQIAKSNDATKLFFIWADSDTNNTSVDYMNRYPDVLALGYDVNSHLWTNGGVPKNFTKGTIYDGANFFMCASDWTMGATGVYNLGISTEQLGLTGTDPVDHYFLTNAGFTDSDFTGIGVNEISNGIATVSQNYPNPANGTTTINVNLAKSAKLSMVVTNLMGQKVYEVAANTVAAGTHTLTIDASVLSSGVYFYTVNADNSSITKKMIVE